VPAAWVTGDEVYGHDRKLRCYLEEAEQPFVLAVPVNEPLWVWTEQGPQQRPAGAIAAGIDPATWERHSCGEGAKGPRRYDWARVPLSRLTAGEWEHWLLVRRSISPPEELAYYVVFAPAGTALPTLAGVAGSRWAIEESIKSAKGEVGLDQYEVRKWAGWYRHITLALLAHAFLAVTRATAAAAAVGAGGTGEPLLQGTEVRDGQGGALQAVWGRTP
jgi:SRSO17 transposase